jgi:hypothetical protein
MSEQIHERRLPFERPPRIRSMLTLSVASEVLALAPDTGTFTTQLQMREQTQEFDAWYATIVAGSSTDILTTVAGGTTVLGIAAPPELAVQAFLGEAPFTERLAIRRIFSFGNCEVVCSAGAPEDFVLSACRAIEARKEQLGIASAVDCCDYLRQHESSVPLHPVAEAFWFGSRPNVT